MPFYDYRCDKCGKTQDAVRSIADRHDGPDCTRCGAKTTGPVILRPVAFKAPQWNMSYYDVGLGMEITSEKQLQYERDKRGLVDSRDVYGDELPELECTYGQEPEKMKVPGGLYEELEKREDYAPMLENVEVDSHLDL